MHEDWQPAYSLVHARHELATDPYSAGEAYSLARSLGNLYRWEEARAVLRDIIWRFPVLPATQEDALGIRSIAWTELGRQYRPSAWFAPSLDHIQPHRHTSAAKFAGFRRQSPAKGWICSPLPCLRGKLCRVFLASPARAVGRIPDGKAVRQDRRWGGRRELASGPKQDR